MQSSIAQDTRIAVVTHELFYGASQALRDYLNTIPTAVLTFISHPINRENPHSYVQVFHQGRLQKQKNVASPAIPVVIEYIVHEILTFVWIFQYGRKYDVFIGVNPLNCLVGILCRNIGWTRHVIFYAIDFTPKRFENRLLNWFYHRLELFCVMHADERWNVSPRIAGGREKFLGFSHASRTQKVVPIGVWQRDIVKPSRGVRSKPMIIFVGHILKKQGIQMVIRSLPFVAKKIPNITFMIVGDGKYRPVLEALVKQLRLTKRVIFHGAEHDQDRVKSLLSGASLAVACYDPSGSSEDNFTYYADPTKIKTYLASGIPVIMTDISYNAAEIQEKRCGIVVAYDKDAIAKAIIGLLQSVTKRNGYRKNAVSYIKKYSWEKIFDTAFSYEK